MHSSKNCGRLLFTLALMGWISSSFAQEVFLSPNHDFRAAINVGALQRAVERLGDTRYRGQYITHNHICSSPDLQIKLSNLAIDATGFQNFLDAEGGLVWNLKINPKLELSDCVNTSLQGSCAAGLTLEELSSPWLLAGRCWIGVLFWRWEFPIRVELPVLVKVATEFPLRLGKGENEEDEIEFGEFYGDEWKPSSTPALRIVHVSSRATASAPEGGVNESPRHTWVAKGAKRYFHDITIGPLKATKVADKVAAVAALQSDDPIEDDKLIGISVGSGLFGSESLSTAGSGIFAEALPIRIHGEREIRGKRVGFDVYLTKAKSTFILDKGMPKISIEFGIEKARVWNISLGKEHVVQAVGARLVIDAPRIGQDGNIAADVEEFSVIIQSKLGSACFCFPVDGLKSAVEKILPTLGTLSTVIPIELPECIAVHDPDMEALDRNWHGYSCKSFGGQNKGFIANADQDKASLIKLEFGGLEPQLTADKRFLHYSLGVVDPVRGASAP